MLANILPIEIPFPSSEKFKVKQNIMLKILGTSSNPLTIAKIHNLTSFDVRNIPVDITS